MLRKIEAKELIGKTIEGVDNSAVNVLTLLFTDGTKLALETTVAVSTAFGDIHGIYTDGIEATDGT